MENKDTRRAARIKQIYANSYKNQQESFKVIEFPLSRHSSDMQGSLKSLDELEVEKNESLSALCFALWSGTPEIVAICSKAHTEAVDAYDAADTKLKKAQQRYMQSLKSVRNSVPPHLTVYSKKI